MITHPGCGLCCGRAGGILSDGERVVSNEQPKLYLEGMGTSKVEILSGISKDSGSMCSSWKNCDAGSVNELNSRKGKQTT